MKTLLSKGVTNSLGKQLNLSWSDFCSLVREHSIARSDESDAEKRSAPWFSAAEYEGGHRRRENLIGKPWAIVADLDEVFDPAAVEKALIRWEYIAWTTWRSTPEKPRWRVVMPVEGGVEPDRFGALVDRVLAPIGEHAKVDSRSRMPEQLWFLPWHKRSSARDHVIWTNDGSWIRAGQIISVNFTGVRLVGRPEQISSGDRNNSLVIRLSEADALRSTSQGELHTIANEWNKRLKEPMHRKEVADVVRKTWNWMMRGEGSMRRAEAWRGYFTPDTMPDVGVGLLSDTIRTAKMPPSLCGDFLFPGATMISAKMKEGKSFLAMQLAMSLATGEPFLAGAKHPGFSVRTKKKVVIIAGEDTAGGIAQRFLGSIAAGHLPEIEKADDVRVVFNEDLDEIRKKYPKAPGLSLFEGLIARWYDRGYRVVALDPLRVLEAALGIDEYPGASRQMNAHARDFQTMRYYTKVAQNYDDLCILVSMHHGKNKRDHDASDPGDMIAGTTGFGAGAVTTVSLLPIPEQLEAEEDFKEGRAPKRRELYLHGRYTREQRLLIEQDISTGIWEALGSMADETMSIDRAKYFEALLNNAGTEKWLSAETIATAAGARTRPGTVHKVLNRAFRAGNTYLGWRLIIKRGVGGGYKLIPSHGARQRVENTNGH